MISSCAHDVERVPLNGTDVVLTIGAKGRVCEIRNGRTAIYPYDCDTRPAPSLCEASAQDLREKGCELMVMARMDERSTHRLLLSGKCGQDNGMCGSFGFWLFTASPQKVVASPVLTGCFGTDDPQVTWTNLMVTLPPDLAGRPGRTVRYDASANRWR